MNAPKYFFARFGDPVPPAKDAVESGIYHPDPRHRPFQTEPGDVILLYCSAAYREYPTQAPGLGIVLNIDEKSVYYRYLPLSQSVGKERIEGAFGRSEIKKFQNGKNWQFGLFPISGQSFAKAVGDREIRWP